MVVWIRHFLLAGVDNLVLQQNFEDFEAFPSCVLDAQRIHKPLLAELEQHRVGAGVAQHIVHLIGVVVYDGALQSQVQELTHFPVCAERCFLEVSKRVFVAEA